MIWRYLLAFALSMVVLIAYPLIFPPPPRPLDQQAVLPEGGEPGVGEPADGALVERGVTAGEAPGEPPEEPVPSRPRHEAKTLEVTVPGRIVATADSRAGVLSSVWLPEFHEDKGDEDPYQLLYPVWGAGGAFELTFRGEEHSVDPGEHWKLEAWQEEGHGAGVRFENKTRSGLEIAKVVMPGVHEGWTRDPADGEGAEGDLPPYHLEFRLEIKNTSSSSTNVQYLLYGPQGIDSEMLQAPGTDITLVYGVGNPGKVIVDSQDSGLTDGRWELRRVSWVGVANNYFAGILIPGWTGREQREIVEKALAYSHPDLQDLKRLAREQTGSETVEVNDAIYARFREDAYKNPRVSFQSKGVDLAPGESLVHRYTLFVGPRLRPVLASYGPLGFEAINDYGVFGLVNMFMRLLEMLKTVVFGSWGAAIVLMTVLVKLCLHPINKRSQRSIQRGQKKMQKVKPQMDALKEQYKDNRMKLNQELQKLFKENDVNPAQQLGGCLVLLLQLPIWFALYNTLRYAIGLRQEGFLYMEDLTRPDALFGFGASIPVLGSSFNLLPILYVILTVVNQQLQPKPEDPQMRAQFRMMTFMMVFFGFIFYQFPSGFMLYIMTSAALGIVESKIIKAELAREDTLANSAGGGAVVAAAAPYPARSRAESRDVGARRSKGSKGKRRR